MRLTEKTIDHNILNKINTFDDIKNSFNKKDHNQYVLYNGNEFELKELDTTNLDELMRFSDVHNMIKSKSRDKYNLSARDNIITDTGHITSMNFPSLLTTLDTPFGNIIGENIIKFKVLANKMLLLTDKGDFEVLDMDNETIDTVFETDAVDQIKSKFNIEHIYPFDITDFDIYGNSYLISTVREGIFMIDSEGQINDLMINEKGIQSFKYIGDNKVIVTIMGMNTSNVKIYDIIDNLLIESYNHLRYMNEQRPTHLVCKKDMFAILASPLENGLSDRNIHIWKREDGFWNNVDYSIHPHKADIEYVSKFMNIDNNNIYIIGGYQNSTFMWKWDINSLHNKPEEILLEDIDVSEIDNIYIKNDIITLDVDNRIMKYDMAGNILKNLTTGGLSHIDGFVEYDNTYFIIEGDTVFAYKIPEEKVLSTYNINLTKPNMNIIEVIVDGDDTMGLTIVDRNKLIMSTQVKMIKIDDGLVYMKIINTPDKNLSLVLTVPDGCKINDIRIRYDRLVMNGDV